MSDKNLDVPVRDYVHSPLDLIIVGIGLLVLMVVAVIFGLTAEEKFWIIAGLIAAGVLFVFAVAAFTRALAMLHK